MAGNKKLPQAEKFFKKRKKLKIWHSALLTAGAIVVFITTYMLILPAITAEVGSIVGISSDESLSSGGSLDVEINEETAMEPTTLALIHGSDSSDDGFGDETSTESETEAPAEETTEPAGDTLDDYIIADVTLGEIEVSNNEELEEENPVVALFAANGIDPDKVGVAVSGGKDEEGNTVPIVADYNPETGDFKVKYRIDFTMTKADLLGSDNNKIYEYELPPEVIVPESLLNTTHAGYKNGTNPETAGEDDKAFDYTFEPVYKDGSTTEIDHYNIKMTFRDNYLESIENIQGFVQFNGELSHTAYTEDGTINISGGKNEWDLNIDSGNINFPEDQTINMDIAVSKTGKFNSETGKLEYEVIVLSKKGTAETITLEDVFTNTSNLPGITDSALPTISVESCVVGVDKNGYVTNNSDVCNSYYGGYKPLENSKYTVNMDEAGKLSIILPEINGVEENEYVYGEYNESGSICDGMYYPVGFGNRPGVYQAEAYIIKYSYDVEPDVNTTYNTNNTASVKFTDTIANKEIGDDARSTVVVTGKPLVTKSSSVSGNVITWTINVGNGTTSISGDILTDTMFDKLTADELKAAIKHADGSEISDGEYTINTDENGKITGITFGESAAKTKYVIQYTTTHESSWTSTQVKNDVNITTPDGETGDAGHSGSTGNINGDNQNAFSKKFDSATKNESEDSYSLSWTSEFTVPESGIPSGVTFTDNLSTSTWGDKSHYLTKEQANNVVTAINAAFGEDKIKDIEFYYEDANGNGVWSVADSLPEDAKVTSFHYTTANRIEKDDTTGGKLSYTYSSTAYTADVIDSKTFYNSLGDGNKTTPNAEWRYDKKVVKYDEDSKTGTTNREITSEADGTVTWIVRVVLDSDIKEYNITDTLPKGITLKELYVAKNGSYNYEQVQMTAGSVFGNTINVSYTSEDETDESGQVIKLSLTNNSTDADTVYVKYVCSVPDTWKADNTKHELLNTVKVTVDGETEYGTAAQTQIVEWTEKQEEQHVLDKRAAFNINEEGQTTSDNLLHYSIDINADAINYPDSNGELDKDLDFKDTLEYYTMDWSGVERIAQLIPSSVKMYKAQLDKDRNAIKDADGHLVAGEELEDFAWTFDVNQSGSTVTKCIYATIPNATPLVFKYDYKVTVRLTEKTPEYYKDTDVNVSNKASISIDNTQIDITDPVTRNDKYEESGTSGGANAASTYTIYKIDKDNYSLTLPNAEFELYKYDGSDGTNDEFIATYVTDKGGKIDLAGVRKTKDDNTTVFEITLPDGSNRELAPDTIYYFKESKAPEGYKLESDKLYFFFGTSAVNTVDDCSNKNSDTSHESNKAVNVGSGYTKWVKNEHSVDYFAEKTNISVNKKWFNNSGTEITGITTAGSVKFSLYKYFVPVEGGSTDPTPVDPDDGKLKVNWATSNKSNSSNSVYSGSVICNEGDSVTLNIKFSETGYCFANEITVNDQTWNIDEGEWQKDLSGTLSDNISYSYDYTTGVFSLNFTSVTSTQNVSFVINKADKSISGVTAKNNTSGGDSGDSGDSGVDSDELKDNQVWVSGTIYKYNNGDFSGGFSSSNVENGNLGTINKVACDIGSTATVNITGYANWAAPYSIYNGDTLLVSGTAESNGYISKSITVANTDMDLKVYVCYGQTGSSATIIPNNTTTEVSTEGESSEEESSEEESVEDSSEDVTVHEFVFDDLVIDKLDTTEVTDVNDAKHTVHVINDASGYFTFNNALVADDHGTATGNLKVYKQCIRLTDNPKTEISFTINKPGVVTLLFGTNCTQCTGANTHNTGCVIVDPDGTQNTYNGTNLMQVYLDKAGTYTIQKSRPAYLFYIKVEEGASAPVANKYKHSFNNGLYSNFYTIEGATSTAKGTVTYGENVITQALKMNSKAKITFTAPEDGTLRLIFLEDPNKHTAWCKLDGTVHTASPIDEDGDGITDYWRLTCRVSAGAHTITRNKDECNLFYMEYMPDLVADKTEVLEPPDVSDTSKYTKVEDVTLVYTDGGHWVWSKTDLPWEVLNNDGSLRGHWKYVVVEEAMDGYTTGYVNNEGIDSGAIYIQNHKTTDDAKLTILKKWLDATGADASNAHSADKVKYEIYQVVNLEENTYKPGEETSVESTTEAEKETATEVSYEAGEGGIANGGAATAICDSKAIIAYDSSTNMWTFVGTKETQNDMSLRLPFKEDGTTYSTGTVTISGTVKATANTSWNIIQIRDAKGSVVASLRTLAKDSDGNIPLALRVKPASDNVDTEVKDSSGNILYIDKNKTYDYEFVFDLDNDTVKLTLNESGSTTEYSAEGSIKASSVIADLYLSINAAYARGIYISVPTVTFEESTEAADTTGDEPMAVLMSAAYMSVDAIAAAAVDDDGTAEVSETSESGTDNKPSVQRKFVHNFTKTDINAGVFRFSRSDGKDVSVGESWGSIKYDADGDGTAEDLTTALKMEGATQIKFGAPAPGTLKVVFGSTAYLNAVDESGNPNANYGVNGIKINGGEGYETSEKSETDTTVPEVLEVNLDAGSYTFGQYNKQCFIYYLSYECDLKDAPAEGVKISEGEIGYTDNWQKIISGLPLNILDDNGKPIGYYTYYVKEVEPNTGYEITYTSDSPKNTGKNPQDATFNPAAENGQITITNKAETDGITLPESGGGGVIKYTVGGIALIIGAAYLLYKRRKGSGELLLRK